MAHVPLEQRSTTRLLLGFVGTTIVPVAAALAVILFCILHVSDAFGDLLTSVGHFLSQLRLPN